jgi:hypothetical protein
MSFSAMPAIAAGSHIAACGLINRDIAGVAVVVDVARHTSTRVEIEGGVGVHTSITRVRDGPQCTEIGIVEFGNSAGRNLAVRDIRAIRQRARTARINKPDVKIDIGIIVEMAGVASVALVRKSEEAAGNANEIQKTPLFQSANHVILREPSQKDNSA